MPPAFFVNGVLHDVSFGLERLQQAIDEESTYGGRPDLARYKPTANTWAALGETQCRP